MCECRERRASSILLLFSFSVFITSTATQWPYSIEFSQYSLFVQDGVDGEDSGSNYCQDLLDVGENQELVRHVYRLAQYPTRQNRNSSYYWRRTSLAKPSYLHANEVASLLLDGWIEKLFLLGTNRKLSRSDPSNLLFGGTKSICLTFIHFIRTKNILRKAVSFCRPLC